VAADNVTENMANLSIQPEATIKSAEKADIDMLVSSL
jgi:hypothetical protein